MEILDFDTLKAQFGEPEAPRRWHSVINTVLVLFAMAGFIAMLGGIFSIRSIEDVAWSTLGVSFAGMTVFFGLMAFGVMAARQDAQKLDQWITQWIEERSLSVPELARMAMSPEIKPDIARSFTHYLDQTHSQWRMQVAGLIKPSGHLPAVPSQEGLHPNPILAKILDTLGIVSVLAILVAAPSLSISLVAWLIDRAQDSLTMASMLGLAGVLATAISYLSWYLHADTKKAKQRDEKIASLGEDVLVQLQASIHLDKYTRQTVQKVLTQKSPGWSLGDNVPLWNATCCADT